MQQLKDNGIIVLKQFFPKNKIDNLRESAKDVFKIQFKHFGYTDFDSEDGFKNSIDPNIIGNITNLRFIPWKENILRNKIK